MHRNNFQLIPNLVREVGNVLMTLGIQTCRYITFVFIHPRIYHYGEVTNGSSVSRCSA
jgi:hypothetical protein